MTANRPFPRNRATQWLTVLMRFAACCLFSVHALAETAANYQSPVGVNLQGVSYASSELPFLNVFKMGGGWLTQAPNGVWNTNEEQYLNLDTNGYPISLTAINDPSSQQFDRVGVQLLAGLPNTSNGYYPGGQYVVLYDGQGTIKYWFDGSLVSHSPGRDVINVNPSQNGILLQITSTDPNHTGDYIRNIRVVQAQYESLLDDGQVFNPAFLNDLKNFRALRFMDWLHTNNSQLSSWSDRPLPTDAFWGTAKGVPLEVCIELANAVSADAWLNIPIMATDDYVTQMAKLVANELGPTQKAYIELSNEVWNGIFGQNAYSISQGLAAFPQQTNKYYAGYDWYGMRVAQIGDIWYTVFGSSAFNSRVVIVMAGQSGDPPILQEELSTPDWSAGPAANHHIGAAAVAGYFMNAPDAATVTNMLSASDGGLSELFSWEVAPGGDLDQTIAGIAANVKVASAFHLPLVSYEGGSGLQGQFPNYAESSPQMALFKAANTDPRMATVYTTFLNDWKAAGATLFMQFNDTDPPTSYGLYGLLDSLMQATEPLSASPPKWQAVQNFIANDKCWWPSCAGTMQETPGTPGNFTAHAH